jgi:hypothetical protein
MGDYGIELDGWADYVDARDEERWYDGYEDFQYQQWRAENPEAAAAYDADMAAIMQAELEAQAATADEASVDAEAEVEADVEAEVETEAEAEAETTPSAPPSEQTEN